MSSVELKLFVAGETGAARKVIEQAHRILQAVLGTDYDLRVIDVLQQPELAEQDKVLATPTLMRCTPSPSRRVIGDLSNQEQVRDGLDL